MRRPVALLMSILVLLSGCAAYRTPGAGVNIGQLSKSDGDIAEIMKRAPAAPFPARVAVARVQATGYGTDGVQCVGEGQYCVVTTREIETERDFETIARLPMISGVAPMSRMLVAGQLSSVRDLRVAAAQLRADLLLGYTVDTRFRIETTNIGPLSLISLGFLPHKKAKVTSTAAAMLVDVRTGFLYGVVEATATEEQRATVWSTETAVNKARVNAEVESFQKMLGEFEKLWNSVIAEHSRPTQRTD